MPIGTLTTLDFLLIGAYFLVLILIGLIYSRKQSEEDYLIAERKLGSFSTMMTINATKTGTILMLFVALVYLWGFSAIWFFIGVIAGIFLFIPFALRLRKESDKYYTLADYFKHKYGKTSAYFASSITIIYMFGFLVVNLIAGAKIFVFFTGWPFWTAAIIMIAIVLFYLLLSGYKAVVMTDVLQYFAIVFIMVVLASLLFNGSFIPTSEWNVFSAGLLDVIGFFIVGLLVPFASPELWQRIYSAKGRKEVKSGLLWSLVPYAIVAFLLSLIALTVKALFPNIDPDLALIHGFANLLPPGILGLSVVLLFGAIMSTMDTYIYTAASSIVQDFFNWDKQKTVKNIRKVIFLISLIALAIAISIQSIITGTFIFIALVMVLAVPVIATWIKKDIKQRTLLFGFIIGLSISVLFTIYNLIKGDLQPTIVVISLAAGIIGIAIGGIVSFFKK